MPVSRGKANCGGLPLFRNSESIQSVQQIWQAFLNTLGAQADLDFANGGDTPVEGLAAGDASAFKTADGKYGIFSITAVTGTNDGTIALTIKIQDE